MKRNDWIGILVSLVLHAGVLLIFSLVSVAAVEPAQLGFVEVEFGPFAEGRPVTRAPQPTPELEPEPEAEQAQPDPVQETAPETADPVALPETEVESVDPETIAEAEPDVIAPPAEETAEDPEDDNQDEPAVRPLGTGDPIGETATEAGDEGDGNQDEASAPYVIEGLDRLPVSTPPPSYPAQVNADIRVRITVDPSGRITQRIPLLKGNPQLEQAVMQALSTWRFNPLPPDVPQEGQTGTVTFRFRLQ